MPGKCIHHWHIDQDDVGVCQKCGEVKDFRKLRRKLEKKIERQEFAIIPLSLWR